VSWQLTRALDTKDTKDHEGKQDNRRGSIAGWAVGSLASLEIETDGQRKPKVKGRRANGPFVPLCLYKPVGFSRYARDKEKP